MNIFERAVRAKLRFSTNRGEASVEDLFDLSLQSLDTIAKAVNKKLKEEGEESFIDKKTKTSSELELKLDILKHVIGSKQAAIAAGETRAANKARVEFLSSLVEKKKIASLESMSMEELEAQLLAAKSQEVETE